MDQTLQVDFVDKNDNINNNNKKEQQQQQYLSYYWPDLNQALKVGSWDQQQCLHHQQQQQQKQQQQKQQYLSYYELNFALIIGQLPSFELGFWDHHKQQQQQ